MSSLLYRIGEWCYRRRRLVVAGWVVILAVLAVLAVSLKQPTTNSVTIPGTESQHALNLLDQKFPGTGGAEAQVVFSASAPETLTDSAHRQAIEATLTELRKLPQVVQVTDPFQAGTISKNGRIAYAVVAYPVAVANVTSHSQSALLASGAPAKAAGITVNFGGQVAQASTKTNTEAVGIVIAFLVLLIGFGSVIVGILPLVTAIAGVVITNLALLALTGVVNETSTTSILATMIGLAVGIDYSLFVLNRHRQQLVDGLEIGESVGRAVAISGSSVCFAGTTVLIALAALSVVNIPFLTVMGLAAAGAVVVAVLAAVTLMPALLGFAGGRLLSSRWARHKVAKTTAPGYRSLSRRYVTALKRAPITVVLAGIVVLLVVASPSRTCGSDCPTRGLSPPARPPAGPTISSRRDSVRASTDRYSWWCTAPTASHPPRSRRSRPSTISNAPTCRPTWPTSGRPRPTRPEPSCWSRSSPRPARTTQPPPTSSTTFAAPWRKERAVRAGYLRDRPDRPQHRHIGQTLVGPADLPGHHYPAVPDPAHHRLPFDPGAGDHGDRVRPQRPGRPGSSTFVFQKGHLNGVFGIARSGPVLSFLPIILLGHPVRTGHGL